MCPSSPEIPRPLEPVDVALAGLPASLDGLTVLHLTDFHTRRARRWHDRLVEAVSGLSVDLVVWTGDYIDSSGDERAAYRLVNRLIEANRPRLGAVGVYGNHDSVEMRRLFADLPIHWLTNDAWVCEDEPITVLGVNCTHSRSDEDVVRTLRAEPRDALEQPRLRILLAHLPAWLPTAADAGIDLVFSGHTHGGQIRLPGRRCIYNGTDGWPLHMTTGLIQRGHTMGVVSRGLGEARREGLRLFCPRQALVVTLKRDADAAFAERTVCVERW